MDKIYVILFNNGDTLKNEENIIWTFTETEHDAIKLVSALHKQLRIDICRYNHFERLKLGGKLSDEANREYEYLMGKYPICCLSDKCINPNFYYVAIEKKGVEYSYHSELIKDDIHALNDIVDDISKNMAYLSIVKEKYTYEELCDKFNNYNNICIGNNINIEYSMGVNNIFDKYTIRGYLDYNGHHFKTLKCLFDTEKDSFIEIIFYKLDIMKTILEMVILNFNTDKN